MRQVRKLMIRSLDTVRCSQDDDSNVKLMLTTVQSMRTSPGRCTICMRVLTSSPSAPFSREALFPKMKEKSYSAMQNKPRNDTCTCWFLVEHHLLRLYSCTIFQNFFVKLYDEKLAAASFSCTTSISTTGSLAGSMVENAFILRRKKLPRVLPFARVCRRHKPPEVHLFCRERFVQPSF
jgi:hypothetical protein